MLAAHERVSDVNQMWGEILRFEFENDVLLLHKKSIEAPHELTDQEKLRLESWLSMIMGVVVLNDMQNRVHGLQGNPTNQAPLYAEYYFSGQYSRTWLRENKAWYDDDAPELIEKLLEEFDRVPASTERPLQEP
jgi:hypothetical protein